MPKREFGELENSILQVMQSGQKMTVKEVQQALGDKDKYTTVMTVMSRLSDKKMLERERVGNRYEYWLSDHQVRPESLIKKFRSKLFGLTTANVVTHLINEAEDLTLDDLEDVEKMIAEAKKRRKHE